MKLSKYCQSMRSLEDWKSFQSCLYSERWILDIPSQIWIGLRAYVKRKVMSSQFYVSASGLLCNMALEREASQFQPRDKYNPKFWKQLYGNLVSSLIKWSIRSLSWKNARKAEIILDCTSYTLCSFISKAFWRRYFYFLDILIYSYVQMWPLEIVC